MHPLIIVTAHSYDNFTDTIYKKMKFLVSSSRKHQERNAFFPIFFYSWSGLSHALDGNNPPVGVNPCLVRVLKYQFGIVSRNRTARREEKALKWRYAWVEQTNKGRTRN